MADVDHHGVGVGRGEGNLHRAGKHIAGPDGKGHLLGLDPHRGQGVQRFRGGDRPPAVVEPVHLHRGFGFRQHRVPQRLGESGEIGERPAVKGAGPGGPVRADRCQKAADGNVGEEEVVPDEQELLVRNGAGVYGLFHLQAVFPQGGGLQVAQWAVQKERFAHGILKRGEGLPGLPEVGLHDVSPCRGPAPGAPAIKRLTSFVEKTARFPRKTGGPQVPALP